MARLRSQLVSWAAMALLLSGCGEYQDGWTYRVDGTVQVQTPDEAAPQSMVLGGTWTTGAGDPGYLDTPHAFMNIYRTAADRDADRRLYRLGILLELHERLCGLGSHSMTDGGFARRYRDDGTEEQGWLYPDVFVVLKTLDCSPRPDDDGEQTAHGTLTATLDEPPSATQLTNGTYTLTAVYEAQWVEWNPNGE